MRRISPRNKKDLQHIRVSLLKAALNSPGLHPGGESPPEHQVDLSGDYEFKGAIRMQQLLAKADFWRSQGLVSSETVAGKWW
jgi:hypothetical protein